ncbi:hypothetical protein [Staphylococcus phage vB_SepM_ phiIPLA-C1C]|jgi:hypothetical protein|uniref:Uncharacterized protein n=2 Tax=Sepunavirus TaxID=1980928 RepID=A0A0D3MWM5_9CAUD|nr:hypothetical protein AVU40_gp137 [Staphylococcus phage phiIPLA-C1C]QLF87326.1 hypothetical protein BESEP6_00172 [Staphylococcus phage vB_SepM_BE06]QLF87377.1 hypothetical protein BESEP7_00029 [Staphylococcus phage vB_SepM_BE07]QLF87661.1 hypothetical protein BESEP8_00113 [Staphylococcus phage vB_SepM_BE08]QLF87851.1 hypothetical protein BESEP9_00103 [Staphylococcus phage vB_SepM_BE09]WEU70443.1 hypothetical protein BE24_0190 [Staphylococcus phage vB_SepM_BE24]WJJ58297.1 hypothetical protei
MTNVWKEVIYDTLTEDEAKEDNKKIIKYDDVMTSSIIIEKNKNILKTAKTEDGYLALIIENGYENSRDVVYNNAEPIVNHREFERICLEFSGLEEIKKVSNLIDELIKVANR